MAKGLNEEIFGTINLGQSLGVVGDVLLYAFLVLAGLGAVYLVYYLMSFRHTLIVRDAANDRKIIKKLKWKEKRDKNNNIWLVTPFNRLKKPLPPAESVELTAKGRKWVEAWRGEDTETLIWIKDEFSYKYYKDYTPEFQPLTTQERELLVNEIAKSKAYQKRGLYDTIVTVTMVMAPIILIAVIALTLGDITEALTAYSAPLTKTLVSVADSFESASANLAGIQEAPTTPTVEVPN